MTKVVVYGNRRLLTLLVILLQCVPAVLTAQYRLKIEPVDRDTAFIRDQLRLQTNFKSEFSCREYVQSIPAMLEKKGYPAASIDDVRYDSLQAVMHLYVGKQYSWAYIKTDPADKKLLDEVVWKNSDPRSGLPFSQVARTQEKMLDYLENNGYPFARISLDSIRLQNDSLFAVLSIEKGPLYKIDSIRNYGSAKISSEFLQRYLSILNGSIYRKEKLLNISKRISELPYVEEQQPWSLTRLGTGCVVNLYLEPRKSSQVNVLIGFLPSNNQLVDNKLLVTGEANVNLKNALGNGETIGLNWQQIQVKSPRLNLLFRQPYLFHSPFGASFGFDLLKKDSSYININLQVGAEYSASAEQTGTIFLQNFTSSLLTVDTNGIRNSRRLPDEADVRSLNLGVSYDWNHTDYRYNPRSGTELKLMAIAGNKKIKKNNLIVSLKDASDPDFDYNSLYDTIKLNAYQFRIQAAVAQYWRVSRVSTVKTSLTGAWFESPAIFRNELFQIGGYKLLRGFDEESIFASQYAVGTVEYRYLLGRNSFLFTFIDGGWTKNTAQQNNYSNTYLGAGLGMAFETKAGIFNISYAAGKRDDTKFNLRQSKIHLGYVNYF